MKDTQEHQTALFFRFEKDNNTLEKFSATINEKKGILTLATSVNGSSFISVGQWIQFKNADPLLGLKRFNNFSESILNDDTLINIFNCEEQLIWLLEINGLWNIRMVEEDNLKFILSFSSVEDAIHYKLRWL